MATLTPSWSDNVSVVSSQSLARGSTVTGTIDLRTKYGAYLFVRIGRGGTAALTNGVDVLIRRTINNNAIAHPSAVVPLLSTTAAANSTTVSSDSNSGQAVLTVASGAGFAAGDLIVIGPGTAREEWGRVSKISGGTITLDRNLTYTHTSGQADAVRNKADIFAPVWVWGGALMTVIFDYGDDSAGDAVQVECLAQTYDSETVA